MAVVADADGMVGAMTVLGAGVPTEAERWERPSPPAPGPDGTVTAGGSGRTRRDPTRPRRPERTGEDLFARCLFQQPSALFWSALHSVLFSFSHSTSQYYLMSVTGERRTDENQSEVWGNGMMYVTDLTVANYLSNSIGSASSGRDWANEYSVSSAHPVRRGAARRGTASLPLHIMINWPLWLPHNTPRIPNVIYTKWQAVVVLLSQRTTNLLCISAFPTPQFLSQTYYKYLALNSHIISSTRILFIFLYESSEKPLKIRTCYLFNLNLQD